MPPHLNTPLLVTLFAFFNLSVFITKKNYAIRPTPSTGIIPNPTCDDDDDYRFIFLKFFAASAGFSFCPKNLFLTKCLKK